MVNDTRYDNHHGGLRVMANLHLGMQRRGWRCVGSLPVSATVQHLARHHTNIARAKLIVVNGEGTLHHNSRNAERLLSICNALCGQAPIALINALWQDNDTARWQPLLSKFNAIYTRDRRSQAQLQALGLRVGYAPDLTFYHHTNNAGGEKAYYLCTDSVLKNWNEQALNRCDDDPKLRFATLLTRRIRFSRGVRDYDRQLKHTLYPWLFTRFNINVPARYKALVTAVDNTDEFIRRFASYRAVCAARYHALCFALQQQVPVLAISSNSQKSEALLEEAGLPLETFMLDKNDTTKLTTRLQETVDIYSDYAQLVTVFNRDATEKIDAMFDYVLTRP